MGVLLTRRYQLLLVFFTLLEHVHKRVELVDVLLVDAQLLRERVLRGENERSESGGKRTLRGTENAAHQVVGHGLGADVERQAGQLGGVLELSVERAQVHRQEVVLGEGRTLRTNVDGSSKAAGIQKKMQQR